MRCLLQNGQKGTVLLILNMTEETPAKECGWLLENEKRSISVHPSCLSKETASSLAAWFFSLVRCTLVYYRAQKMKCQVTALCHTECLEIKDIVKCQNKSFSLNFSCPPLSCSFFPLFKSVIGINNPLLSDSEKLEFYKEIHKT